MLGFDLLSVICFPFFVVSLGLLLILWLSCFGLGFTMLLWFVMLRFTLGIDILFMRFKIGLLANLLKFNVDIHGQCFCSLEFLL